MVKLMRKDSNKNAIERIHLKPQEQNKPLARVKPHPRSQAATSAATAITYETRRA